MKKPRIKPNHNLHKIYPMASAEEFPSSRYFQIHFEHLENLLNEAKLCMEALKRQLAEMNEQANPCRVEEPCPPSQSVPVDTRYSLRCDPPLRKAPGGRPPRNEPPYDATGPTPIPAACSEPPDPAGGMG